MYFSSGNLYACMCPYRHPRITQLQDCGGVRQMHDSKIQWSIRGC